MLLMNQVYLEQFSKNIVPYGGLWQSVRVTCLAVHVEDAWINLGLRVLLSESSPASQTIVSPDPRFRYFVCEYPLNNLGRIVNELVLGGYFTLETDGAAGGAFAKVFLSREQAGMPDGTVSRMPWFGVVTRQRPASLSAYGIGRPCITLAGIGDRVIDLLSRDLQGRIDSKLRLGEPGFDGLDDLVSVLLPGIRFTGSDQSSVEIVAPLPFDWEYTEPGKLVVRAPATTPDGALAVRCFFQPKTGAAPSRIDLRQEDADASEAGILRWEQHIEWPHDSERAKMTLFFRESEIDSLEVNRWPGAANLRVAVDRYFDPEHKRLRDVILGRGGKSPQDFEVAVVRLFNLLGVPLVWYGRGVTEGRPDAAGYVKEEDRGLIIVVECTLERPIDKFSGLAERAKELRDRYAGEAKVLPVVCTRAATTESEMRQAAEHGIALVGNEDLQQLFNVLETPSKPGAAVEFLRKLPSIDIPQLGLYLADRGRL